MSDTLNVILETILDVKSQIGKLSQQMSDMDKHFIEHKTEDAAKFIHIEHRLTKLEDLKKRFVWTFSAISGFVIAAFELVKLYFTSNPPSH